TRRNSPKSGLFFFSISPEMKMEVSSRYSSGFFSVAFSFISIRNSRTQSVSWSSSKEIGLLAGSLIKLILAPTLSCLFIVTSVYAITFIRDCTNCEGPNIMRCEKILIAGFSGAGKTSFLKELEYQAPEDGWDFQDLDKLILKSRGKGHKSLASL